MKIKKCLCIIMSMILISFCTISVAAECKICKSTYLVNENGETYGTDAQSILVGYEADLILAVGENNNVGYVRSADLDDGVVSPTEVANQKNTNSTIYIPLYSSDGETIIDRFAISLNIQENTSTRSVVTYLYGSEGYIYVNNHYNCTTRSAIGDCTNGVRGKTRIQTNKAVSTGWLGVQARIYRASDDALVDSSSYKYSSSSVSFFEYDTYHYTIKTGEAYYSQGIVKTWNPDISGYWTTGTFASPNVNPTIINP